MNARLKKLITAISDLEDHYAELLTSDASQKDLLLVWMHIRELRGQLTDESAGLQVVPYFYGRRDNP